MEPSTCVRRRGRPCVARHQCWRVFILTIVALEVSAFRTIPMFDFRNKGGHAACSRTRHYGTENSKAFGAPSNRSSADVLPHHSCLLVFGDVAVIHEGMPRRRGLV